MFGSKTPIPPAVVQVLLVDYLVEGCLEHPEIMNADNTDYWNLRDNMFTSGLWLTSVRFQPTGYFGVAPQTVEKEFFVYGDSIVAVIPQDDRSRRLALEKNSAWSHPLPAEVHAGPYVIRGTVMGKGPNTMAFSWSCLLMRDLAVASVQRNVPWPGLQAPCAFIAGQHKHFVARLA